MYACWICQQEDSIDRAGAATCTRCRLDMCHQHIHNKDSAHKICSDCGKKEQADLVAARAEAERLRIQKAEQEKARQVAFQLEIRDRLDKDQCCYICRNTGLIPNNSKRIAGTFTENLGTCHHCKRFLCPEHVQGFVNSTSFHFDPGESRARGDWPAEIIRPKTYSIQRVFDVCKSCADSRNYGSISNGSYRFNNPWTLYKGTRMWMHQGYKLDSTFATWIHVAIYNLIFVAFPWTLAALILPGLIVVSNLTTPFGYRLPLFIFGLEVALFLYLVLAAPVAGSELGWIGPNKFNK